MNTVIELLKKILNEVKISVIILTVYITILIFIAIPNEYLHKLDLFEFKVKNQFYISLIALILTAYFLSFFILKIFKKVQDYLNNRFRIKLLNELTNDEKRYLLSFYDKENNELRNTYEFSIQNANVNLLVSKEILGRGSNLSLGGTTFDYFLQPWAYKHMTKLINQGKIKITDDGFIW